MKAVIISFILYVIYDTYMRNRSASKYVTVEEFNKYKADNASTRNASQDLQSIYTRLNQLEQSPYA